MRSSLASRLGDIPGVASVVIDLEGFGRGIDVRLEPGADEEAVMEKLRALLAAYGVKHPGETGSDSGAISERRIVTPPPVDVTITPLESGARIEVATKSVKSFRIVASNPLSIAQGLADAWCQVVGRIPIEILDVAVVDDDRLVITAFDGERRSSGSARLSDSWIESLTAAVGDVLGEASASGLRRAAS